MSVAINCEGCPLAVRGDDGCCGTISRALYRCCIPIAIRDAQKAPICVALKTEYGVARAGIFRTNNATIVAENVTVPAILRYNRSIALG